LRLRGTSPLRGKDSCADIPMPAGTNPKDVAFIDGKLKELLVG
jgi:hypothetical protein